MVCKFQLHRAVNREEAVRLDASLVNSQIGSVVLSPPPPMCSSFHHKYRTHRARDPLKVLATNVTTKIEDGDLRGAIRLMCSEDVIADDSNETLEALQAKHPQPHKDSVIPPLDTQSDSADDLSVPVQGIAYVNR